MVARRGAAAAALFRWPPPFLSFSPERRSGCALCLDFLGFWQLVLLFWAGALAPCSPASAPPSGERRVPLRFLASTPFQVVGHSLEFATPAAQRSLHFTLCRCRLLGSTLQVWAFALVGASFVTGFPSSLAPMLGFSHFTRIPAAGVAALASPPATPGGAVGSCAWISPLVSCS